MNIIEKIKFEEGDKAKMYKCPAGKWTIGAGINLEQQKMPQNVQDLWLEKAKSEHEIAFLGDISVYAGGDKLADIAQFCSDCGIDSEMPQEVRDLWLNHIVDSLNVELGREVHAYGCDPTCCADDLVMLDMAYQMGVGGLLKFKKMLDAIAMEEYETAADELLDSHYARQTPERAKRNADLLRGCA